MIASLRGTLGEIGNGFFVVECDFVGFKVFSNTKTITSLPPKGAEVRLFTFLYVRESQMELYGFLDEGALKLFEMLNTVAGVGPKTALGILDVDTVPNIMAAILEKRADVLTRTSGIGTKTAERIILELHGKVRVSGAHARTKEMDLNHEVEEALVGLGYARTEVKKALAGLSPLPESVEERLRLAFKALGKPS